MIVKYSYGVFLQSVEGVSYLLRNDAAFSNSDNHTGIEEVRPCPMPYDGLSG